MNTRLVTADEWSDFAYRKNTGSFDRIANEEQSACGVIAHLGDNGAAVRIDFWHNGELQTVRAIVGPSR